MSGFTFGIGKDDVKDSVLKDTDFFDKDSIKAGETPEFNTDTSIVNLDSDTDTLEQKQEFEQRALDDVSRTTANSNVSVESLIEKIKRNNGVNKAIALEAYDLGFREQLPKVFTYTDKFSETNLETTLEALENHTPINQSVSNESFINSVKEFLGIRTERLHKEEVSRFFHKKESEKVTKIFRDNLTNEAWVKKNINNKTHTYTPRNEHVSILFVGLDGKEAKASDILSEFIKVYKNNIDKQGKHYYEFTKALNEAFEKSKKYIQSIPNPEEVDVDDVVKNIVKTSKSIKRPKKETLWNDIIEKFGLKQTKVTLPSLDVDEVIKVSNLVLELYKLHKQNTEKYDVYFYGFDFNVIKDNLYRDGIGDWDLDYDDVIDEFYFQGANEDTCWDYIMLSLDAFVICEHMTGMVLKQVDLLK